MLFFLMVLNTALSYAHILYVFYTIKIFQTTPQVDITKKEMIPYHLRLNNEGFIAYGSIKLRFLQNLSEVTEQDKLGTISLEPGQGWEFDSEILCKYSGIYPVGVDTIEIMDYFKIFRIRFPMPQKMRVTVKPRLIEPRHAAFLLEEEEHGSSSYGSKSEYQLDNEVKKYAAGDNKKRIHWKNSAKRQELMVRNPAEEEISGYAVILDANVGEKDYEKKVILCDKLRETLISLVHYIHGAGFYVHCVLDASYEKEVYSYADFDELHRRVAKFGFEHSVELDELLFRFNTQLQEGIPFVIVSSDPKKISQSIQSEMKVFRNLYIIDVNRIDVDEMDFREVSIWTER
ncbi:MAG: DUF58 domain-containing protein [Clostridium sp.]|nr:DUF58 domain-containing protein [Clostridium sp.]